MGKYYLFGAGINCIAAIQFFKRKNIIAVIDNDERKQGKYIEEIPIISLKQYLEKANEEQIIITGFMDKMSISNCLKEKGILHFYYCPYMQTGFYRDCDDIIFKLELKKYKTIYFYTKNPIAEMIEESFKEKQEKTVVGYLERNEINNIEKNMPIVITNQEESTKLQEILDVNHNYLIMDINEIYEKEYGFKNERILKFRDIHKERRCFVIGNGPSLRYSDLDILHNNGEICFGVNRIYLAYEYTHWRPDYYVAVDYNVIQHDRSRIAEMEGIKFIRHFYKEIEELKEKNIYEFKGLSYQPGNPQFSIDMYQGIYMGSTVVYDAIQIAFYMGFREIYLLGVDMTSGIRCEEEGSHFYKIPDKKEVLGLGNILEARQCLAYAGKKIDELGKKLRNATRGGELNEVTRVEFDQLFE